MQLELVATMKLCSSQGHTTGSVTARLTRSSWPVCTSSHHMGLHEATKNQLRYGL